MLSKVHALEQLRPGHELATDKELLCEQSRALQVAHESAAAAHMAAAAHRVAEQSLAREVHAAEGMASDFVTSSPHGRSAAEEHTRVRHDASMSYERSSIDLLQQQDAHTTAALRRAGCELRVLVRSLQALEMEQHRSNGGGGIGAALAKPRAASPRPAALPTKPSAGKEKGKRPPRAKATSSPLGQRQ